MYQALYRRWRPKTFSDVVGQEHVTRSLTGELRFKRISHAYLFVGTRGTGKTTCAKILSKAVNCLHPEAGNPCGECEICKGIEHGSIMDVTELDAASNNSVNDIRLLCENAAFIPARAKFRVYIIDEVHMLSAGAFAALLKTLEEPPEYVIFILATTEIHKLPATILSRCQRFEFHRISVDTISKRLLHIASCEEIELHEDAALLIARSSGGALRDALSLLDKCMSIQKTITKQTVNEILGLVSQDYLLNLASCLKQHDVPAILNLLDELYMASKDMLRLSEELVKFFRDIMIIKMTDSKEILFATEQEYQEMKQFAEHFSLKQVIFILESLQACINKPSGNTNRLDLELTLIKICERWQEKSKQEEKNLPREAEKLSQPKKTENTSKILQSTELENCEPEKPLNQENEEPFFFEQWLDVLRKLAQHSKLLAAAFADSVAYISGKFVLIDTPKKVAFELLKKSAGREQLRAVIEEVTGVSYKLGPYKSSEKQDDKEQIKQFIKHAKDEGFLVMEVN